MKKILILNGPNLNTLGKREPEIYGSETLQDIESYLKESFAQKPVELIFFQSNFEGDLIEQIQKASQNGIAALIINPAGYTHSSVAILDALKTLTIPVIEVHLTCVHRREDFRQKRITTQGAHHVIEGFGKKGYYLAINSQLIE